eukprot:1898395-Amphidinium_carterae.1
MSHVQKLGLVRESLFGSPSELGAPVLDAEAWRDPGNERFVDEYTGEEPPRWRLESKTCVNGLHEEVGCLDLRFNEGSSCQDRATTNRNSLGRCRQARWLGE